MPFQPAMAKTMALVAQMEALAVIAAAQGDDPARDPALSAAFGPVLQAVGGTAFDDLAPQERQILRAFVRSFFRQALDLIENPQRGAGWSFDDPVVLDTIGQGSKVIVRAIAQLAAEEPDLHRRLAAPSRFLDVGSGVGWISIEAARRWPALQVDGFDIFDPALAIAARNLAGSGLEDRVRFHRRDVLDLRDTETYDLAFLAAPFIPRSVVEQAVPRLFDALKSGGWMVFGLFEADPAPLPQALLHLRIRRFGGHPWSDAEAAQLLATAGFSVRDGAVVEAPARLIVARKP